MKKAPLGGPDGIRHPPPDCRIAWSIPHKGQGVSSKNAKKQFDTSVRAPYTYYWRYVMIRFSMAQTYTFTTGTWSFTTMCYKWV